MSTSGKSERVVYQNIIRNMSEGVLTIDLSGRIIDVNTAASGILEKPAQDMMGQPFAMLFFEDSRNDVFNQYVLDAVYDVSAVKEGYCSYWAGDHEKHLHITTSYLTEDGEKIALIVVMSDISRLHELADALKAMEEIQRLNAQLEARNRILAKTFGRFLSDEIVSELLDKPEGLVLGGKKTCLTMMMSDLRGFTALSECMGAMELLTMLNHYLGCMTDIIQRHRGTIIEFIGDGIMAVFGAPQHFDNHAEQAVAAGVEMQACMEQVNAWNREHGYPALQMGIGINTGEAIVGNIGSEKRTKYGVTGREVNLCGRIESFTVGGELLISDAARRQVNAPLTIDDERNVIPKGAKEPMTLYRVAAVGAPYNVSCARREEPLLPLDRPEKISFSLLREKSVGAERLSGHIAMAGHESALLCTDAPLKRFDNILIDRQGDLYAKVTAVLPDGFRIRFTSVPAGMEPFVRP